MSLFHAQATQPEETVPEASMYLFCRGVTCGASCYIEVDDDATVATVQNEYCKRKWWALRFKHCPRPPLAACLCRPRVLLFSSVRVLCFVGAQSRFVCSVLWHVTAIRLPPQYLEWVFAGKRITDYTVTLASLGLKDEGTIYTILKLR